MTDQTPATEAGRRDHDEAWNDYAESEYHMTHDSEREGCGGCAAILAIEAEARAEHWNEGYRAGYSIGRADALREATERVRTLDGRGGGYHMAGKDRAIVLTILDPETTP